MRKSAIALLLAGLPLCAQWLKYPTPGIPRTADGKPNLTAPAPRTADGKPDLSGLWITQTTTAFVNITGELKPSEVRPWAAAVYKKHVEDLDRDTPLTKCLPLGPSEIISGSMYRILQTPNILAILNEGGGYRQVFTDGRPLPKDPNPTWIGYSVGRWDEDTLVVETAGFNDRTWLDFGGHPHTEDLRVTERLRRTDFGHMQLQITYDDPKTFTRPLTLTMNVRYVPDTELLEYVCNENERDLTHMVGKASDDIKGEVKVAPEVLSRYAGAYAAGNLAGTISVSGDQLIFAMGGQGAVPLTTLSETSFYFPGGFPLDFVKNEKGEVLRFLLHTPGPDMVFERKEAKP